MEIKGQDIAIGAAAAIAIGTLAYFGRKQILAIATSLTQPTTIPPVTTTPITTTPTPAPVTNPPGSGGQLSADITADVTEGTAPLTVQFLSNAQGGTAPLQYRWAFGDGVVSTQVNPSHTFTESGAYTVALSIIDANGESYTSYISIATNNLPPPTAPGPTNPITNVSNSVLSGESPLTVGFSISILDPTSTIAWNFGDPNASAANPNTDSDLVVNHSYFTAGTYTVTLTVTSSLYGQQVKTFTVTVTAPPASALTTNLYVSETSGPAPLLVTFSMALDFVQSSIVWTFGDGHSNNQNVLATENTYAKPGTYNGSVTITPESGSPITKTWQIVVQPNTLNVVTASILYDPNVVDPAGNGEVDNAITVEGDAGAGTAPYTYQWNWGDGTQASTGLQPSHTYTEAGTYVITLTVTDSIGDTAQAQKTITIDNAPVKVGDVTIIIVSNQIIDSGGLQSNSLPLQVQNNRQDVAIPGYIVVSIFGDSTSSSSEVGTPEQSETVTVPAGGKIVIPPILTPGYIPGGNLLVIRFFDLSATAEALSEIDLNV